jgi:hypothetical protein
LAVAGKLIGDGDELLGQFLEALVVGDQGLDLRGLVGGDALGELLSLHVALEDVVGALRGFGVSTAFFEELAAQGAAAEAVNGADLLEDLLAALFELVSRNVHGIDCIYTDTI